MRTATRRTSALVGALFVVGSLGSSAYAGGDGGDHDDNGKIVVCHRTSSDKNPWVKIEIPEKAFYKGHKQHGDFKVTHHKKCPPKYEHHW
jgi:hypothetical protein